MKAVIQRVRTARVLVDGECVSSIGAGMLVLLGVERGDTEADAERWAERAASLRFFADDAGRMNRSVVEAGGAAIVVSQFTLAADLGSGRRPSFDHAEEPMRAEALYERFAARLRALGVPTHTGRFGAHMQVELVNDGPVTFVLGSP